MIEKRKSYPFKECKPWDKLIIVFCEEFIIYESFGEWFLRENK